MRQRIHRRVWKQLRLLRGCGSELRVLVQKSASTRRSPVDILTEMLVDPTRTPHLRWTAATVLVAVDPRLPATLLMRRFFEENDPGEVMNISNIARTAKLVSAIPALLKALKDKDENKRYAAAYALGMPGAGARVVVNALARVLSDDTQPPGIRGVAAESLDGRVGALHALMAGLSDPVIEVRFWCVWSLGGLLQIQTTHRPEVISALEKMLADNSIYPAWWSVGKEALAMLGYPGTAENRHVQQFQTELARILNDPAASDEDRRWAEFWG